LDSTQRTHLRTLAGMLAALDAEAAPEVLERARDRLERDLLPRTAGDQAYLVAGIVGPNNAGKSALFNALAGEPISLSSPTGGATRRLVGALHPELKAALLAEPTLARFPLREWESSEDATRALGERATGSVPLIAKSTESMPPGLLLIDTPDFDSILSDNRIASESLLAVADLAIAVVTRHSYQNKEVVDYLRRWLAHGRPWILVYNEAVDEAVVRAHAEKLSADVESSPIALFASALNVEIQTGAADLDPVSLPYGTVAAGLRLRDFLFDFEEVAELKSLALRASLAQLDDDLVEISVFLRTEAEIAGEILQTVEGRARRLGHDLASQAMPGGPFIEAFRTVLDRRANPLTRGVRGAVRRFRGRLERLVRRPATDAKGNDTTAQQQLSEIEGAELGRRWSTFWEELARDLGPEQRHPARQRCSRALARSLDSDLGADRSDPVQKQVVAALVGADIELGEFHRACEKLIEEAIDERGYDWDVQAGANLAMFAPLAIAAVVIVKTGGLGADIGIAGGGALTTYLTDKYSHLLGSRITKDAAKRWAELRAQALTPAIAQAVLESTYATLRRSEMEYGRASEELETLRAALA